MDALGQSAGPALIPVGLVDHAAALGFGLAGVLPTAPDRPLEEAGAAVARVDAVVLAGRVVAAHLARHVEQDTAWKKRAERCTD